MSMPLIVVLIISGIIAVSAFTSHNSRNSPVVSLENPASPSSSIAPTVDPQVLTDTVKQFYSDISAKRFNEGWGLLSKDFQKGAKDFNSFAKGYDSTKTITVKENRIQDLSANTVFIKLQSTDLNHDQIQTKEYSGTWKLIKVDGSWKLDTADITLLSVSPSSRALNVAAFVYAYSSPAEIEDWRNKHGIKKSNRTQEIHDQAVWMDQHPDVLALNETRIKQYIDNYQKSQVVGDSSAQSNPQPNNVPVGSDNSEINVYGGASSYTRIGNTAFGSDGSTYTQVGNSVFGSDGSTYQKVGNTVFGNDGSTYQKIGNTTFGSDGSTYQQIGNTTFGSDGSTSTRIGNTTFLNP